MKIALKTWDGNTINSSSYRSQIINANAMPSANLVLIEQAMADSVLSDAFTVAGRTVTISIEIVDYSNRYSLLSTLKKWFKRGERGVLVATHEDGVDYQLDCKVQNLIQEDGFPWKFAAVLVSGQTAWRAVTADTASWTGITGTGGTKSITVGGTDTTALSLSLTPSVGSHYLNIYQLTNSPACAYGVRPWCITLNTQALVSGGKMLSTCYDLRIYINGREANRWITGANTTTTNVWFNVNLNIGASMKLLTAITIGGTITKIQFQKTPASIRNLKRLPKKGILIHGTEWIYYTAVNANKCYVTVQSDGRGVYGTTLQAHAAGDVFLYQQNVITMIYGRSTATDPALGDDNYDKTKPLFDLTNSTNSSWVYTASTLFVDDENPARTGNWTSSQTTSGDVSHIYQITGDADSGNPALGAKAGTYLFGGAFRSDSVKLYWSFKNPGGIASLTMTGRSYRTGAKWITYAGAQYSKDGGKTWKYMWADATPAGAAAWSAWSAHSAISAANAPLVRIRAEGVFSELDDYILYEALTATVAMYATNLPVGALLGEANNFLLSINLANSSTGVNMDIELPMKLSKALVLDGEAYTARYDGDNVHDALSLDDEGRDIWLPLEPGTYNLAIASDYTLPGTIAAALSWYKRRL